MEYHNTDSLVETGWLADHLADRDLRIVDATWFMAHLNRSAREEFAERHIAGAVFWDIDEIADPSDPLPHMVPDAAGFAGHMARLGIANDTRVIAYDTTAMQNAPRAWWTLRYFGHRNVAVLDGGLKKWLAEGRPTESAAPAPRESRYTARALPALIRSRDDIMGNIDSAAEQVLDARSAGRFAGTEPEPRKSLRSGHIPGSLSLPFTDLIDSDSGTFKDADALARRFAEADIDMARPVATSCGSGVTACVLALGLQ